VENQKNGGKKIGVHEKRCFMQLKDEKKKKKKKLGKPPAWLKSEIYAIQGEERVCPSVSRIII